MRRRFLKYFGLVRPYRFERTLIALAAIAFCIVVVALALYLQAHGHLTAMCLSLAVLEAGFGFGALALFKYRLIPPPVLMPSNSDGSGVRFAYHPLLQVLPVPGKGRINSEHRRGKEWSANELKGKVLVALFGGSTTYEGVNPDGRTWPDQLQALLPPNYVVVNYGRDGFTSAEVAINCQRGIRTIWVGVLLNRPDLTSDKRLSLAPFVREKDMPALVDRLNAGLRR